MNALSVLLVSVAASCEQPLEGDKARPHYRNATPSVTRDPPLARNDRATQRRWRYTMTAHRLQYIVSRSHVTSLGFAQGQRVDRLVTRRNLNTDCISGTSIQTQPGQHKEMFEKPVIENKLSVQGKDMPRNFIRAEFGS